MLPPLPVRRALLSSLHFAANAPRVSPDRPPGSRAQAEPTACVQTWTQYRRRPLPECLQTTIPCESRVVEGREPPIQERLAGREPVGTLRQGLLARPCGDRDGLDTGDRGTPDRT